MATIVQKYGGSSVSDIARLKAVAASVVACHREGNRVVVVVSAMGKTTDGLIAQARDIAPNPPRRELDMLVTAGERIAMALLAMAIDASGECAISFTGSQSGIITDEQHQGARILEVRPARIAQELSQGKIVIVAGYQGVSREREVTTLGRGGTDTTAVALAAALNADACEIYSDVDGVYTADPNVCAQARLLPELPFQTMQAIAGAGARVLNADAVEFARRAGITIVARRTGDGAHGKETRITPTAVTPPGVQTVVGHKAAVMLATEAPQYFTPLVWEHLHKLGARVMAARADVVIVDLTGVPGKDVALVQPIAHSADARATPVGVASVVGQGLAQRVLPAALRLLDDADLTPATWLASDTILTFVMHTDHLDRAVRLLHDTFAQALGPSLA